VLLENLKSAGFSHEDIDVVVLSHLHFDHAGGLLGLEEGEAATLLFPNATFVASAAHCRARPRSAFARPRQLHPGTAAAAGGERPLRSGRRPIQPGARQSVRFHFSEGHTPGPACWPRSSASTGTAAWCSAPT
jgi:glyoxylase-like metal-dependent hydrolase (beta-lactamase superfamily II)